MRLGIALFALLLGSSPAAARDALPYPPESRWNTLPRLAMKPDFKPSTSWIKKAQALEGKGECKFAAGAPGWIKLEIPFVVLIASTGQIQDVKVASTGCPALESYVTAIVRKFSARQIVRPTGAPPYWRGSKFLAGWQK